jgi:hypothetical protein
MGIGTSGTDSPESQQKLFRAPTLDGKELVTKGSSHAVPNQISERVHWTAKTRALIEPHTRSVPPVLPPAPDVDLAVATMKKVLGWRADNIRQGISGGNDRCQRLTQDVLRTLEASTKSWLQDPAELDAARAMLLDVEDHGARTPGGGTSYFGGTDKALGDAFLDFWSARGGLPHAVEMLVLCHSFELTCRHNNGLGLDLAENWKPTWCRPDGIWRSLRSRLLYCSDAEYEASRQTAERLRPRSSLALRCSLDYAFPQEADWVAADAAKVLAGEDAGTRAGRLLASLRDPELAEGIARTCGGDAAMHLHTMMDLLGPAAIPAMQALIPVTASWAMGWRRKLARQLGMIESPRVASYFARSLGNPTLLKAAGAYFERWPDLALPALQEAAAEGRPKVPEFLASLESRRVPEESTAGPSNPTANADAKTGESGSPSSLPAILLAPPWKSKSKPSRKTLVVRGMVVPVVPEVIVWKPGEREFHVSGRGCRFSLAYPEQGLRFQSASESANDDEAEHLADFQLALESSAEKADLRSLFWLSEPAAVALWNSFPPEKYEYYDVADLHRVLARHELAVLPGFIAFARHRLGAVVEVLARVRSPRVAPVMASAHATLVRGRRIASSWLLAFGNEAAVGLIPTAVGEPGQTRRQAESALRFMASQGYKGTIEETAAMCGDEVRAAIAEVMAFDPYAQYPRRLPELPRLYWTPSHWPRPRLLSGEELPSASIDALGTMLAFSSADDPYIGIEDVRRACDARSLGAFAWALFETWERAGAPAKGEWALHALSVLGDDETARQLTAMVEPWSKEGRYGRALSALRVLAARDSETALAGVRALSEKAKSRPLRGEARKRLEEIAERRGLTTDQLADLLVPDLGLSASGTRTLDFGPRHFVITLNDQLKALVKDVAGKVLRDLPEPGAKDDADQARAAIAEWKTLKRQLPAVLKSETARLERAMGSRRRWDGTEFSRVIVTHPILGWLARRLVWAAYDESGTLVQTFRVAEDLTLADAADTAWTIPQTCGVGLPHVLEIEDSVRARWSSMLADYELAQPFSQLDRETFRADVTELSSRSIAVLAGQTVKARKVVSLESRGWDRIGGKDIGVLVKTMHSLQREAALPLEPGLFAGDLFGSPDQSLGPVTVRRLGAWDADPLSVEEMGPVLYSEIVRDLTSLRG